MDNFWIALGLGKIAKWFKKKGGNVGIILFLILFVIAFAIFINL